MIVFIMSSVFTCLLFICLRFHSFEKYKKECRNPIFIVPKKTYLWHILGPFLIIGLLGFAAYGDSCTDLPPLLPKGILSFLAGILTGICVLLISIYIFTDTGIYENGILTHFVFIKAEELEKIEFTDENILNINSNIRTLKIYLKNQALKMPSLEYLIQQEEELKTALRELNSGDGRS